MNRSAASRFLMPVLTAVSMLLGLTCCPAAGVSKPRPCVEVVFCLDTTGSMGGLIEGAKAKIWSVCNQIANGKPTPLLKVGLVAYRDRGDDYVTRVTDLTDDLDAIHGQLKGFSAQGGGDTPESVNQALDDAVNKIHWSRDRHTLRIIFLVGDAPPHMDYTGDVKYPDTCKRACEKGIRINTIQCGGDPDCTRVWKDVAAKAEGSFVAIPQDGGRMLAVVTPYDEELSTLNTELARTTLVYGDRKQQREGAVKNAAVMALPAAGAAERVAYQSKNGLCAAYDLLDDIKHGKVKLESLRKEELPEQLRSMTLAQQREYLDKLDRRRSELSQRALLLDRKRADYIARKQAEDSAANANSFDNQVLILLRTQARQAGNQY